MCQIASVHFFAVHHAHYVLTHKVPKFPLVSTVSNQAVLEMTWKENILPSQHEHLKCATVVKVQGTSGSSTPLRWWPFSVERIYRSTLNLLAIFSSFCVKNYLICDTGIVRSTIRTHQMSSCSRSSKAVVFFMIFIFAKLNFFLSRYLFWTFSGIGRPAGRHVTNKQTNEGTVSISERWGGTQDGGSVNVHWNLLRDNRSSPSRLRGLLYMWLFVPTWGTFLHQSSV